MALDAPVILVAYDGSPSADCAIDKAARLFPGGHAVVVTCWHSAHDAARAARTAMPESMIVQAVANIDAAAAEEAKATAQDGAERADRAGLSAEAVACRADGPIWSAVLHQASERDAAVIVVGSRGRSEFRSLLLGSTSSGVVHHARRPILVVHAPD